MRHFRGHANGFAQRRMRVNRLADIHRVCAHFDGQRNLANHVARVRADHAAAQYLALAPASMAVSRSCFGAVVKQQFGKAFVAAIGNGAA